MQLRYSYHITVERKERFTAIMEHFNYDIGKPVATQNANNMPNNRSNRIGIYQTLTDRGIVLIWDKNKAEILTMYAATIKQAVVIYSQCHNYADLPSEIFQIVKANQKIYKLAN